MLEIQSLWLCRGLLLPIWMVFIIIIIIIKIKLPGLEISPWEEAATYFHLLVPVGETWQNWHGWEKHRNVSISQQTQCAWNALGEDVLSHNLWL